MSTEQKKPKEYGGCGMNEQPTHELAVKVTEREVNLWRVANSKASSDAEAATATKMLLKSLRERQARYLVRELGRGSYNAAV